MKAILATGELATLANVARASLVAMMAGADFIKTSTGKEGVNATLPFSLVMVRMIREYHERTGYAVGFKPAGGIRTREECARVPLPDEGGARRPLAQARPVPLRRERRCSPTSSGSSSTSSRAATRRRTVIPMV